ncbi:MAG: NADH-quinone oxidoreductase subunit K [Deltaproteobacteria bacterium GWA2_38_16]|nr:MAG: NADH-quinone oxidoreductase subunit K [Deltaproteobacteria bacterium GWA2_38_16]OGQ02369.1 MAG: NADH-quinone oxidoreductase subunit K [Deltaproteobacteria bacterium RIFCSPHIGHO2_02_FULL_38_15]OGQ34446.1 MAG: NADH-quinone oxidoreductase subunit K [Deltaproteobacteria bacterium RIFCSPLOWO2_01_FULL_38_9]OGQ60440.1 MAG: NADH-quinone oxidoreductase subunit K [Deltaproteobacteria bacterium RIFCSPLOWO2_12_FULL_38_8]HBQ20704.1 NADH-quinone oxidoreductase subunit NuoK [Deltaproteobacteria bacter
MTVELHHYLILSSILFVLGIIGIISRKNSIGILMGIELVMNACGINFVAFSKYIASDFSGQIFALFIFVIAAAEVVVALAIVLRIYQNKATIDIEEVKDLKC